LQSLDLFLTPRISRLIVSPITDFRHTYELPLSPVIADIVLQDPKSTILEVLTYNIPIYYRYVDDILIAAPKSHWNYILNIFNSFHERPQNIIRLLQETYVFRKILKFLLTTSNLTKKEYYNVRD